MPEEQPESKASLSPTLRNKGGKAMDAFLEAFCALDADNREVISLEDLRQYNQKNNLEDTFPESFASACNVLTITLQTLTQKIPTKYSKPFRKIPTYRLSNDCGSDTSTLVANTVPVLSGVRMLPSELRKGNRHLHRIPVHQQASKQPAALDR
ncbi:hypothetical protein P879_02471 [Paragonimus westermani]|uniref:EF-hand domain-containing protein n=1 Tax=Paragonimus westermani TaxID=34504 RepID=A0A8T0DX94_9TREM|nr:hypothetical protein P879_02471 [Paragonimus westermani]